MTGGLDKHHGRTSRDYERDCDIFLIGVTVLVVAAAILNAIFS